MRSSIAVTVSASNAQNVGVNYLRLSNNLSRGNFSKSLSAGGVHTFYAWIPGGESFYIKISNAANNGNWISGGFNIKVDKEELTP